MTTNDKPEVDFNLDSFKAAEETRPYGVILGGKRYEMTHMDDLDAWDVVEAFLGGEVAATKDIIEQALGSKKFAEFKGHKLKKAGFDELVKRYLTHCGVNVGK